MGAPFAKVVNMDGNQGTSRARNEGLKHARGSFIVWMDADDYWLPWFLDRMVAHGEVNQGVIFCDLIKDTGDHLEVYRYPEFESERVPNGMRYAGSSILVPRYVADKIMEKQNGWDERIPGMEDWDYQIAVHDAGFCAYHVAEALFVYRVYSSTKRERDYAKIDKITSYVDEKWSKYRKEGKIMGCGCGGPKIVKTKPASTLKASGNFSNIGQFTDGETSEQLVMVEYLGDATGKFTIRSRVLPGKTYRFANTPEHKVQTVFLKDAEILVSKILADGPEFRMITGAKLEQMDPGAVLGRAVAG
jgi:glycosyltransferase involved in cell wall biosynthesis